jgi:hypothetical protein
MVAQAKEARPRKQTSQRRKHVTNSVVSLVGGVLVAFVSVLPQLHSKNSTIEELTQKVEQLVNQDRHGVAPVDKEPAPAAPKLTVDVRALDSKTNKPLSWKEVFLIPSSNDPMFIRQTDGEGKSTFVDVPDQQYWLVVRDNDNGSSVRGLIYKHQNETKLGETLIRYDISDR